jgi:hypothetical protein
MDRGAVAHHVAVEISTMTEQYHSKVDGLTAYEWVRSMANALYWNSSLYSGKEGVPYGSDDWMRWRSSTTVMAYMDRAKEFVPPHVWQAYEEWEEADE